MNPEVYERHLHLDRNHFWRRAKRKLVLEMIDRYAPKKDELRILDVGSATSHILLDLQNLGSLTAVEPSMDAIQMTKDILGIDLIKGSLPYELPNDSFDLLTLLDVLEHVDDDLTALREMRERLSRDGILICTVPAYQWLWSSHDEVLQHRRRYTKRRLHSRFLTAGMRLCHLSYYTCLVFPLFCAQRILLKSRHNKAQRDPVYDVSVPSPPINFVLGMAMNIERPLMRLVNLPFGSSLIAVAKKG